MPYKEGVATIGLRPRDKEALQKAKSDAEQRMKREFSSWGEFLLGIIKEKKGEAKTKTRI